MKPAPFDYERPATLEQACRLLAEAGGGATLIAGGQTLMPLLNLRMSQPFVLVDLSAIPELCGVKRVGGGTAIGPMTTQSAAMNDPLLRGHVPLLARALAHVGHHQTRNRGTIGGSIAFAEPAAEVPATALALDAVLTLQSLRGSREIAMRDFLLGPYLTALEADEIVTAITIPDPPPGRALPVFTEVARRPGDFALVGLTSQIVLDGDRIAAASLAWFGMGPTALRAVQAEAALNGAALGDIDAVAIAGLAVADTQPFDDKAASAAYRTTVGRRICARAIRELAAQGVPA
ncbi:xanthine dehydrogenase family protein subunit M [Croceicoccus sp. Ery5]|uniref:FAD binding domain-containing protein n=1 Tax=Croceicoccus sp. Ery5 TaxID=1703340 RepID=UPI001E3386D6|nr:xanthine dehydrogenase family protein subunit M [Croceicoccus sp. Ery5]